MRGSRHREAPRMVVVAGPPGGGKSRSFPVSKTEIEFLNADDRAAQLNDGDCAAIPSSIRDAVSRELGQFIDQHIQNRLGFALPRGAKRSV